MALFLTLMTMLVISIISYEQAYAIDDFSFKTDVIYQIIVDRFYDGDPSNNNPFESPGLYDSSRTKWKMYWGGDLQGIIQKIPYLKELGVTTLWISPVNDNLNTFATSYNTGYHGYWTRDFMRIEEHFGTWETFEQLVAIAHQNGMKVIVDFVPNHTTPIKLNDPSFAEGGAIYNNGVYMGNYFDDSDKGYFRHNGDIQNWDDRYEAQYMNFTDPEGFSLSDLSQENETIACYLIDAAKKFLEFGVDGIRIDAVKHFNQGFQKNLADELYANKGVFLVSEWYGDTGSGTTHDEKVRYANESGITILDFDLNTAIRNVFGYNHSMYELNEALSRTDSEYKYKENLVTFIDNHDMPRFLSINGDYNRLHQALAFILTNRGIPTIYYGTEQYLYNNTSGGYDPYNRPMMDSFDTTSNAFRIIKTLSQLRKDNPAVSYGTTRERWINDEVFIYERQFFDDVVLVAINKSTSPVTISGLYTSLPAGSYDDILNGLQNGNSIVVKDGDSDRLVETFILNGESVSVWSFKKGTISSPQIGSVDPIMGRSGNKVTIWGQGFGSIAGKVYVGTVEATVSSWSDTKIVFTVPSCDAGIQSIKVVNASGKSSNTYDYQILSGDQAAVVFKVKNAPNTQWGEAIYLVGNIYELGNWDTSKAIGPMLCPEYPDWFYVVSVPKGKLIEFKFIKKNLDGSITWESGFNHIETTPVSETGDIIVNWQY
ncbi:alpha-amylase family glycosyl hydrolase [Caloranaerobacter ferrireducens]|uniref:alpha-amylase family glycosyl hydrolase n=1 Tax=Caloranaerobacter ferrireducens TaxID=1323370 RepID=UPI00084D53D9|nr:alpha-amylase family glycosyl hydrolase [Caloranaerobacter ferrireducens]